MNSDFSPKLQAELLDDFYAECDEQLSHMREQLAAFERLLASGGENPAVLESLYRSLHSLKGNAAMVGLRPAEELAHVAETFLRQLSRGERRPSEAGLQVLIDATQRLEQVVSAHRLRQAIPDTSTVIGALTAIVGHDDSATRTPGLTSVPSLPSSSSVEGVESSGSPPGARWRAVFFPSKERDAEGINLNGVRSRLAEAGNILQATPVIGAGGTMSFEFIVAFREPPLDSEAWKKIGVELEKIEAQTKPEAELVPRPAPRAETAAPAPSHSIAPSHIVRVDLSRLDELMRIAGELVIHRSRLEERLVRTVGPSGNDGSGLHEVNLAIGRSLRDLRQAISRVRLVPVAEIFTRLPFVVRDLIQETGKQARLVVEGQQTEIDKYLVERLKEPLLHLVRNAFAHGVESTERRLAAGKPAEATILLRATAVGQSVVIQIRDDGAGIDAEAVARRATAAGLTVPAVLDLPALLELLCTPGFSTRDEADRAAGRGVGMSVVQTAVRELGGTLTLETEKGQWTQFTLRLPLTLSIIEAFIVAAGDQICAVPRSSTEEIIQISTTQIRTIGSAEVVPYRDGVLPMVRLRTVFGAAPSAAETLSVLVLDSDRGLVGLAVDRVASQREIVVRPMKDPLVRVPGVHGATELGDGRAVLILDAAIAGNSAVRPRSPSSPAGLDSHPRSFSTS